MAVVVDLSVPSGSDGPGSTPRRILDEVPDIELEVVNFVPIGTAAVPYFWAWGQSIDRFERALEADPEIENVERIERVDDGALFSVQWDIDDPVVTCLSQANGAIMDAYGTADEWKLTLWFEHHRDATSFQECCGASDISYDINRVRSVADITTESMPKITRAQREALLMGYERGFFDDIRGTTQAELADELEVSSSALGRRMRRGISNLIEDVLVPSEKSVSSRAADDD